MIDTTTHRNLRELGVRLELREHAPPVHARHQHVERDQARTGSRASRRPSATARRVGDVASPRGRGSAPAGHATPRRRRSRAPCPWPPSRRRGPDVSSAHGLAQLRRQPHHELRAAADRARWPLISPPEHRPQKVRVMASPRPVPPNSRVVDASAWVKASKIRASCSGVMPMPVSETRNSSRRAVALDRPRREPQLPLARELRGVRQQVEQDLTHLRDVRTHRPEVGRQLDPSRFAFFSTSGGRCLRSPRAPRRGRSARRRAPCGRPRSSRGQARR